MTTTTYTAQQIDRLYLDLIAIHTAYVHRKHTGYLRTCDSQYLAPVVLTNALDLLDKLGATREGEGSLRLVRELLLTASPITIAALPAAHQFKAIAILTSYAWVMEKAEYTGRI